jgi:tRNA modification GTPase
MFSRELPPVTRTFRPTAISGHLALPTLHGNIPATLFLSRAPRSYTGQDLIEIHTIGSPPILELALSTLVATGARYAMPGEFTMRAFLNRKLDLTAAEAILGLIDATDTRQATSALRQMAGGIARPIDSLRERLLNLLAELEAGLDFADEDLEFIERPQLLAALNEVHQQLQELNRQMHDRQISIDRARVILIGPPNAGKSSLFNAMLGRTAALVSEVSGTTRDYLVAPLELEHCTVELVDTAGTEQASSAIGRMAQGAREQAIAFGDLFVLCHAGDGPEPAGTNGPTGVPEDAHMIVVRTKLDLRHHEADSLHFYGERRCKVFAASSVTGAGLEQLKRAIEDWARGLRRGESSVVASTAARCRLAIDAATRAIGRAIEQVCAASSDELTAMDIRLALDDLSLVVGAVYTDDILDRVFSRFCIGK